VDNLHALVVPLFTPALVFQKMSFRHSEDGLQPLGKFTFANILLSESNSNLPLYVIIIPISRLTSTYSFTTSIPHTQHQQLI
jgi:hypothetical protein